jgi:hypothetical protein
LLSSGHSWGHAFMSGEQAAFSSVLVESDDWRVRESCCSPEAGTRRRPSESSWCLRRAGPRRPHCVLPSPREGAIQIVARHSPDRSHSSDCYSVVALAHLAPIGRAKLSSATVRLSARSRLAAAARLTAQDISPSDCRHPGGPQVFVACAVNRTLAAGGRLNPPAQTPPAPPPAGSPSA